jgi:hypothetical protein
MFLKHLRDHARAAWMPVMAGVFVALPVCAQVAADRLPGPSSCRMELGEEIPRLAWIEGSDWINVKRDVLPGARGDGVADDTRALQAALDEIGERPGTPKVVYLPSGVYRITRTLTLSRRNGGMLVGHGRDTVIRWDGARDGRMFWSNGAARQIFMGLVWDGAGEAGVGIDHDSKTLYETRVRHQHMELRNFREAGIRTGHDQRLASAEMMFYNLLFRDSTRGALFASWNDYNNVFDGCHFLDNEIGIDVPKGNVVVRNSRFERSRRTDLFLSTHSHSVRRVVSVGSQRFIDTVSGPAASGVVTVQDCRVDGWKSAEGAITARLRGPLTVFDCVFSHPPDSNPPIRLAQPSHMSQTALFSGNRTEGVSALYDRGPRASVHEIPRGARGTTLRGTSHRFLRSYVPMPTAVLDVRRDCGARGELSTDDTDAVRRCVDRARTAGGGSAVYFPSGYYRVRKTIPLAGAGYRLTGSGFHSQILWSGASDGTLFDATGATDVVVTMLAAGGPASAVKFFHGGAAASRVRYDGVYGWHEEEGTAGALELRDLPPGSVVTGDHFDGVVHLVNAGAAQFLPGFLIGPRMEITGGGAIGGFIGALARASCCDPTPLLVRAADVVVTDWYNEQSARLLSVEGGSGARAFVTLDFKRAEAELADFAIVRDFGGRLSLSGGLFGFYGSQGEPTRIELEGNRKPTIALFGSMFQRVAPRVRGAAGAAFLTLHNNVDGPGDLVTMVANAPGAEPAVSRALDDFREIGARDAALNYCIPMTAH